jgi:glutathione S-transferase
MNEPPLILHQYDVSPASEKVRVVLGAKQMTWSACDQPQIMPKDDLTALTGGYRRVPMLQIGADLFFDSGLIIEELERRFPHPRVLANSGSGIGIGLQHWAEGSVLMTVASLLYGGDRDSSSEYQADRSALLGRDFDVEAMERAWSANSEMLRWHLALLDRQLTDERTYLTGSVFDIADATFYALVRYIHCGKGKTAALLRDFPLVEAWADRIHAIGHGQRSEITRAEAIEIAKIAKPAIATGRSSHLPHEPAPGDRVRVKYFDANTPLLHGVLMSITPLRLSVRIENPALGPMVAHMPRTAGRVLPDREP